jgi:GNAT superfamily N-acetyltransferase
MARPEDASRAREAAALIRRASRDHDIARRATPFLRDKILSGKAVLALHEDRLVGFGYFSDWEGGRFVSHSGLVVDDAFRGRGLGRRMKTRLMQAGARRFPEATVMSLTTSPAVLAMNRSLGFRKVPVERLTTDPAFWEGCKACRNYAEMQRLGRRCCCDAMILSPRAAASAARKASARAPRRRP